MSARERDDYYDVDDCVENVDVAECKSASFGGEAAVECVAAGVAAFVDAATAASVDAADATAILLLKADFLRPKTSQIPSVAPRRRRFH